MSVSHLLAGHGGGGPMWMQLKLRGQGLLPDSLVIVPGLFRP